MGKNKKQFIDKKTAHKFTLVHRSQRDPLQADEDSAQHVLMSIGDTATAECASDSQYNSKEENVSYGVYFNDDYDYMQHLRPRGQGTLVLDDELMAATISKKADEKVRLGNLLLPSEALPSELEEDVGMLNKGVLPRGPQPDWDPDIVAALDDGVDFDDPSNMLEDDFMKFANGPGKEEGNNGDNDEWETESENSDEGSYIGSDNLLSDEEFSDNEEETKSRFTNYSMTSSVIRRTQGLKLLDDQFEKIMEEYDEDEIGCMDHEEVTGKFDVKNELVEQVVDEFIDKQKMHELSETKDVNSENAIVDSDTDSVEESDDAIFAQFKTEPKEKWDCESIISTFSNLYNHPTLIVEDKKTKKYELDKRTGIPVGVFNENKKNKETDENCDVEIILDNVREKTETPEERKLRKQNVKEFRKSRRLEKKQNKLAFKTEFKKQEKVVQNTAVQKGIKMA